MIELPPFQPETQEPAWDYQIALDGVTYRIVLQWRDRQESWYLTMYDADENLMFAGLRMSNDTPLGQRLIGRRIETGVLILLDTEGSGLPCAYEDLGFRCQLFYYSLTEFAELESEYDITIAAVP